MMKGKHILVVEDDPDGQEMVTTMLQHMQFTVDTADNGEQALQSLNSRTNYSAVIIDLALPGKDGWELLEDILAQSTMSHLPCIAITAFHNSKLRENALLAGFTAYFSKPIDDTELQRELVRLLST
jgi:CheY-like chemotaxis protein